ncbi:hypothetical protein QUB77_10295 [Microcoleus sp. AT9b-C3]
MTNTQLTLDKKAHPLMMHLSILSKYDISEEPSISYDPSTQTSTITSMSGSWSTRKGSTEHWLQPNDEDQKEDD